MDNSSPSAKSKSASAVNDAGYWPDLLLVAAAIIWGINIPLMKIGLDQLDPFVFNAIRLAVAAAVLNLVAQLERQRGIPAATTIGIRPLFIYGILASAAYQLLFLLGVDNTTSGNTALIITTVPLWTSILAWIFGNEHLRPWAWFGLSVALFGTVIVALQKGDITTSREHQIGNLLILAAALLWSGATVYSRSLLKTISPVQLSAAGAVVALPMHLLFAAGRYQESLPALRSLDLWLIILYSGVLSTGLSLPMWHYGVRHAGAAHASIIQNLIPLIAIIAAWVSRGESATIPQLVGGALILTGLVIMRRAR